MEDGIADGRSRLAAAGRRRLNRFELQDAEAVRRSGEEETHRLEFAGERVQDEAEILQRNYAE
jgi:hypothetical protein